MSAFKEHSVIIFSELQNVWVSEEEKNGTCHSLMQSGLSCFLFSALYRVEKREVATI